MSLFTHLEMAPRDPILGISEQFNADPNPAKVNLGVGMYFDDNGKLPVLACVATAEKQLLQVPKSKGYLPIDGIAAYDKAVQGLVFGPDHALLKAARVATVQALGGTGGLKVGADLLKLIKPGAVALISDPTWDNHRGIFAGAGFDVQAYPYYDPHTRAVRFEAMLAALQNAPVGSVAVLHACCHNPTGCDLSPEQWDQVVKACQSAQLVPFLDMAYQGFGDGISEDAVALRRFIDSGMDLFIATSFSKNFSLYGERAGALSVVCSSADDCQRVLSQLKIVIRTNYSTPPTFGATVVATVLNTPELRAQWEEELAGMRERVRSTRETLAARLRAAGVSSDLSYITRQKGMFSYSGLTVSQMQRLRNEFGVYGLDSGRICVAAINSRNMEAVVAALAKVMTS